MPLITPLYIYTDSKSNALHFNLLLTLSESKALKLGAGTIVRDVRKILLQQKKLKTTTKFIHVAAHTGQQDVWSRGNAIVDLEAKHAALNPAYQEQHDTPYLSSTTPYFLVQRRKHNDNTTWYTHF